MLEVKLLVPFLIGSGSLLYPLAIGAIIVLSNPSLNLKIALLAFSKHSSSLKAFVVRPNNKHYYHYLF